MPGIPFTSQSAHEYGIMSGLARRLNPAKRHKPSLNGYDNPTQAEAIRSQLRLVKDQIKRTRDVLDDVSYHYCQECERGGIEPHHRAQLLKALDCLLDRQRKLLGIPDPANAKAPSQPRRQAPLPEPTPIEPACGPDTPTGSGPTP